MMILPPHELLALIALDESYGSEGPYLCFAEIGSRAHLDRRQTKRAVRRLAKKGLAHYRGGLFTEDGRVAGGGYCCTKAGHDHLADSDDEA